MSFDVIQAGHLTPRHLGRLARGASGGKFRRLRYFRASFPHRSALVVTLRFEDGATFPVSPDSWMHVMHEDFPASSAELTDQVHDPAADQDYEFPFDGSSAANRFWTDTNEAAKQNSEENVRKLNPVHPPRPAGPDFWLGH